MSTNFEESDFKTILVIGMGLMGGSLLMAIREKMPSTILLGFDSNSNEVDAAKQKGFVDEGSSRFEDLSVESCDLIVLATPIRSFGNLIGKIKHRLKHGAVVTDLGSVKDEPGRAVVKALRGTTAIYVGGHPMNGSEKNGLDHASSDLYRDIVYFVVKGWQQSEQGCEVAAGRLERWIEALGARPFVTDPATHDRMTAKTSHMPHLVAALLVQGAMEGLDSMDGLDEPKQASQSSPFAAGGFRDTTRIAGGSPGLWADVFIANKKHMISEIEAFMTGLSKLRKAVDEEDQDWVTAWLSQMAQSKKQLDQEKTFVHDVESS